MIEYFDQNDYGNEHYFGGEAEGEIVIEAGCFEAYIPLHKSRNPKRAVIRRKIAFMLYQYIVGSEEIRRLLAEVETVEK